MRKIGGSTKLTGIIGYPLRYTLSPSFQNAAFEHLGFDWCYLPLAVEKKNLSAAIEGLKALGFMGVNVTMPYKEEIVRFADELKSFANLTEVVNTLVIKKGKIIGYNTDGEGFLKSLKEEKNFLPRGKNFLIVGAGGAAKAIAFSLAKAKAKKIVILNRTLKRAEVITKRLKSHFPSLEVEAYGLKGELRPYFDGAEVIINATSIGMKDDGTTLFNYNFLRKRHLVCDLVYSPSETRLLKEAKKRGADTLKGIGMLIYQGALSFKLWTGKEPPIEVMRKALRGA